MGLYKRGDLYWMRFTVGGKEVRKSTGLASKRKAEDLWAQTRAAIVSGQYVPEAQRKTVLDCPTFEIAVESYIENQVARGKKEYSYCALTGIWSDAFDKRKLDTITSEQIERQLRDWQAAKGWSNATRNNRLNQITGLFSYAYGKRWIDSHPTAKGRVTKLHVDNARERWLRPAEIAALVAKCHEQGHAYLAPIVEFTASTGMRLGEVCALTRADLAHDDQERAYLVTMETKNKQPLYWPLEGGTLALVEGQLEATGFPGDYIFPGPKGGNARSSIRRHLKTAAESAGIEWGCTRDGFTFHSLRRTMASLGANNGIPHEVLAKMGNWKDRRMVERYAKFSDETFRDAAGKLGLDRFRT